jgi:monoamine oxidase
MAWCLHLPGEVVTDSEGVSITFDASVPDIGQYALVAFFDGNPARQWSEKTKEVRRIPCALALCLTN